MKDLILISESLLKEGMIPTDLLDPDRFDLRSIQQVSEMIILVKVKMPRAVVVDLDLLNMDINEFVKGLRAQCKENLIPILGALKEEKQKDSIQFYQSGVNSLLFHPFGPEELREALQTLMGLKFRRYERKQINYRLNLTSGEQNWEVMGKIINRECVMVQGDQLPSQGMNVFISSAGMDPLAMVQWSYCWRAVKGGLVLRFLNPTEELLQKIDALPIHGVSESPPPPATPTEKETPPPEVIEIKKPIVPEEPPKEKGLIFLDNPHGLHPIDMDSALPIIQDWAQNKGQSPFPWPKIFAELPPEELVALTKSSEKIPNYGKFLGLKILLETQLKGLQSTFMTGKDFDFNNAQKILQGHERLVSEANKDLQNSITNYIQEKNEHAVGQLNQLKSILQKTLVGMQKTLNLRKGLTKSSPSGSQDIPISKIPGKRPIPSSSKKLKPSAKPPSRFLERMFLSLMILSLFFGGIVLAYIQITAPKRRISQLSQEEVTQLSTYFHSVKQFKGKGKLQYTIRFKKEWDSLEDSEKGQEIKSISEKFKLKKINMAKIQTSQGRRYAVFLKNQMKVIRLPTPKKR